MNIDIFKSAFRSLSGNKSRTFLTILGVVIGIFSVVTLVSIGQGAQVFIENSLSGLGTNLIVVIPGQSNGSFQATITKNFTTEDFEELSKLNYSYLEDFDFEVTATTNLTLGNISKVPSTFAILGNWPIVRNTKVSKGNYFTDKNINTLERVILIGPTLATDLFGDKNPLGEVVKLNNIKFTIIGILEEKGAGLGSSTDSAVIIPYETYIKIVGTKITPRPIIYARSKNSTDTSYAKLELQNKVRSLRGIKEGEADDFLVQTSSELLSIFNQITSFFTIFLGSVAAISLIVGGIGIMNIMFVSVTERTKEIGLRKSLGAKRRDILLQFLVEAIFVTFFGGIIGITLSLVLVYFIFIFISQPFTVAYDAIIYALVVSIGIGIVFGIYPAYKASLLSPIDALRSD